MIITNYQFLYCPDCGAYSTFILDDDLPHRSPRKALREDVVIGSWNPIRCKKCGWKGYGDELLDHGEYMNIKRTKLIDKIIDEAQ